MLQNLVQMLWTHSSTERGQQKVYGCGNTRARQLAQYVAIRCNLHSHNHNAYAHHYLTDPRQGSYLHVRDKKRCLQLIRFGTRTLTVIPLQRTTI